MKLFLPTAISFTLISSFAFSDVKQACFKIEGMTCHSCANGITSLLTKQKGVKKAETSFPKKHSVINYESKDTNPTEIKKLLEVAGYKATAQTCK